MASKKYLKFCLMLLGAAMCHAVLAHSFYVSVYSVNFVPDQQELNIVCKVFTNDLEDALKRENAVTNLSVNATSSVGIRKMVSDYILEKTEITLNGKPAVMVFKGLKWEGSGITETTLCHFSIKDVTRIGTIEISTRLLTELYDDQVNIVNVRVGDKRQALNLDKRVNQGKLTF